MIVHCKIKVIMYVKDREGKIHFQGCEAKKELAHIHLPLLFRNLCEYMLVQGTLPADDCHQTHCHGSQHGTRSLCAGSTGEEDRAAGGGAWRVHGQGQHANAGWSLDLTVADLRDDGSGGRPERGSAGGGGGGGG